MSKRIHIIYVPGFGGKYDSLRLRALHRWRYSHITVEMVPMNWTRGTLDQKMTAIDRAIDRVGDKRVVLVGESAGGSMVVHMMSRRDDIDAAITICGKNSHPETTGNHYVDRSVAFRTLMERLNESLDSLTPKQRLRMRSITPLYDETVPIREMLPAGIQRVKVLSVGHFVTILMVLTVYSPIVIHTARRLTKV